MGLFWDRRVSRTVACGRGRFVALSRRGPGRPVALAASVKAPVDISRLPHQARVVAQALKTYGLILADNGSPSYISGAPNAHWNNGALHQLDQLTGSDFEVVNTTSLPRPGL